MLLVIGAITAALVVSDLPADVETYTKAAVCKATGGENCEPPRGGDGPGGGDGSGAPSGGDGSGEPGGDGSGEPGGGLPPGAEPAPVVPADVNGAYDRARGEAAAAENEAAAAESEYDAIISQLGELVAGIIGLDDIEKCLNAGDPTACLWALASVLPVGKAGKLAKAIPRLAKYLPRAKRIYDRVQAARRRRAAAQQAFRKAFRDCARNSFDARTKVLMADGSRRPIADVRVGDRVWAADPLTGGAGGWQVTALIRGTGVKRLVDVTVDPDGVPGGPTATVTATGDHPFWVAGQNLWIDADDLMAGDALSTPAGTRPMVVDTREYTRTERMYNFTVADRHTYYVAVGASDVLVHNACFDLDKAAKSGKRAAKGGRTHAGREYQKHMDRGDLPTVKGKDLDRAGEDLLEDILTDPSGTPQAVTSGNFAGGTRIIGSRTHNGKRIGATFDANGVFQYFGVY